MGKKHSNKKKKKTLVDNVSKNSKGGENTDIAFNMKPKEEKRKHENDTSLKVQNKLSNQSIKALSCKSCLDKPNKPDSFIESHSAGANKSKKSKPSSMKPSSMNNFSQYNKIKPITLAPLEKKNPALKNVCTVPGKSSFSSDSEEEQFDYSIKKDGSVRSKSGIQLKGPKLLVKDFNDKSYLTDFLGNDCDESDKAVACDIFLPKFDENPSSSKSKSVHVASHNTGDNKSSKKCKSSKKSKSSSIKQNSVNNLSQTHTVMPVTLAPFEKKDPFLKNVYPVFSKSCFSSDEEEQFDSSIRKNDCVQSKSTKKHKVPELLVKDFNDKLYLSDFLGDDYHDSAEGLPCTFFQPCDFFQPVFDEYQNSKNSKNKSLGGNLNGINEGKTYFDNILSSRASSSTARSLDKYDLEKSDYRLDLPSYSPVRCSKADDFDYKNEFKENISCRVNAYKNSKEAFAEVYRTWLPKRRSTLDKLKTLLSEVHDNQLNFNKSQIACKKVGYVARSAKDVDNQVLSFLGSVTAFLTDAASGVVSAAQAFNIDAYQSKFKEIMEEDAKFTKCLYSERSNCVMKYQNIEEVMRKFHPDSFSTTVSKISNSLEINKYWKAMKEAYGRDDMPQLLNIVSKFFDSAFQPEKLEEVKDSVLNYVGDNPKALEACKSATQATYGYLDTWTLNQSRVPVLKGISSAANSYLMYDDLCEIERLRNAISEDLPQSKLESQIEDAIDSLESEMKEINHTFYELFKIYVDSSGCEWEISEMY